MSNGINPNGQPKTDWQIEKAFTQRHFEALAAVIQDAKIRAETYGTPERVLGVEVVQQVLAEMFAVNNRHFDRARFDQACEPGAPVRARHNWSGPAMPYVASRS